MRKIVAISILIFNFLQFNLFAAKGYGTTSMDFLKMGIGARALSMGEAYASVSDEISGVYWNPAGLYDLPSAQLGVFYNKYVEDIHQGFVGFATPQYKYGGFAFSTMYLNVSQIDGRDKDDNKIGTLDSYSAYQTLTYVKKIDKLGLGLNYKLLEEKLIDKTFRTSAIDVGIKYKVNSIINIGGSIQNIGLEDNVKYVNDTAELPVIKRIGISANLKNLLLAVDNITDERKNKVAVGAEYKVMESFYLRSGFKFDEDLADGLRAGFGLNIKNIKLDYGFVKYEDLDYTHQINLTFYNILKKRG